MTVSRNLPELLGAVAFPVPSGLESVAVKGVRLDSRKVQPGELFLALRGSKRDGAAFAEEAARRGAAAILAEGGDDQSAPFAVETLQGIPLLRFRELRAYVGPLFDAWHGFPSRRLEAYAVTGTNGKSTTTRLITAILRAAGRKVISLGTLRYELDDEVLESDLTTPGPDVFFDLLARGVAKGCDALAMEASSHALSQDRIRGMRFRRAIFTNLTQDHLDFHSGFEDYFAAKKKLFTEYLAPDGVGVVNLDTPYGARLFTEWGGSRITFSRAETPEGKGADVVLRRQELSLYGTRLVLAYRGREFDLSSRLVGTLNVENLLAAAAFGLSLGMPPELVADGVAEVTVPGRNEVLSLPAPGSFAVVDYAHTPDALERVLNSLRPLTAGKLWCLFGCGGDRDRSKRPLMGGIAQRLADRVVITSDNPRSEPPEAILAEIRSGMLRPHDAVVEVDRRKAIRSALASLQPEDCLLVAGKGHENYQILGAERRHFSDQEEIAAWAKERRGV